MNIDGLDKLHDELTSAESKNERNHAHEELIGAVIDAWPEISVVLGRSTPAGAFRAGAEAMREAAAVAWEKEAERRYATMGEQDPGCADFIRDVPIPEPPK